MQICLNMKDSTIILITNNFLKPFFLLVSKLDIWYKNRESILFFFSKILEIV